MNRKFYNLHFIFFLLSVVFVSTFHFNGSKEKKKQQEKNEWIKKTPNRIEAHEKEIETNEKSRGDYQFCFGACERAFRSFWSVVRILKCHCLWNAPCKWMVRKKRTTQIHTHTYKMWLSTSARSIIFRPHAVGCSIFLRFFPVSLSFAPKVIDVKDDKLIFLRWW